MNASLFKKPDAGSLRLWALVCLLPALAFAFLTKDVWLAPRSVVSGIVASKSFKVESRDYGAMHLTLSGQPYNFYASMKIVAVPERRPASSYDAVKRGSAVSITVFSRDIAGLPSGATVPVLGIEQSGQSVFISGTLFLSWAAGALLMIAVFGGLLGITVDADVLATTGVGHFLRWLDRPAQKLAGLMSPIREFETMEQLVRHERVVIMGRCWTVVGFGMLVIIAWLLLNLVW